MEGCAGELALAEKARHLRIAELGCVCAPVSARDQDDLWAIGTRGESTGDVEAVHPGQLDIEENDVWVELRDRVERGLSVFGKAHDVEALELEQGPGRGAKVLVVIDDQQRLSHDPRIVA